MPLAHSIPRRDHGAPCALSFPQERLWFENQLEPGSPAYNQPRAIRLVGHLNVSALTQALDTIIARHEVLRTTIASPDGNPVQIIGPARLIQLPIIDLTEVAVGGRKAALNGPILLVGKVGSPLPLEVGDWRLVLVVSVG